MARIPDEVLLRLKSEVSVRRLAEDRGVVLKKVGRGLKGLCPFHAEKTPSLAVDEEKNVFHCFGCEAKGTSIDWVRLAHGVSFRHAVELLLEMVPGLAGSGPPKKDSSVRHLKPPIEEEAEDRDAMKQVVAFYHETLKQSPEALAYLDKRGLSSPEMIGRFQLGFANRTLGYRLPEKNRKAGEELRGRLQRLGLLRDSGHEHFNGSIVVPVFDEHGQVSEIYGRKVTPEHALRKGTPLHLYLPGPHKGVFNREAIATCREVILCEAILDALTFWCAGYENVTSSYGVSGFTDDHLEAFRRHGTERVLLAYDRDDAGDRAAEALAEKLLAEGIDCYRVQFPRGMDANEYALKVTPGRKSLGLAIRKAAWMGSGKRPAVELGVSRVDRSSDLLLEEASPLTAEISPPATASLILAAPSAVEVESPAPVATASFEPLATPAPQPAPPSFPIEVKDSGEVVVLLGDRRYRIRGMPKNLTHDRLSVIVLVTRDADILADDGRDEAGFFADRLDLYCDARRQAFAKQAALDLRVEELVIKKDLGRLLLKMEELQEALIRKTFASDAKTVELTPAERAEATALLSDPNLLDRIAEDFERTGVVGERTNALMGYLASVSRKLAQPLAVIIQSSSAAGKSSLLEAILAFVPEEEREKYSAMTGQSLFYMEELDLKHKVLALVEEEGAERATYALKLLQSEGELTIASTGKDGTSGRLVTKRYHVEGPVMILLTTTAVEIDEELLNRAVVLTVNEDREQTRAIHRLQRESQTIEGVLAREERRAIVRLHQNAQRLLRPLRVVVPFARELTFPDERTRTRRDHGKYLTLIQTVTLLHQQQREVKRIEHQGKTLEYIEATREDVVIANRLAHEVLGRSLDELAPQTRRLLLLLDAMVTKECERLKMARTEYRFSRREVREATGWTVDQLRVHLGRLVELEYLIVHHGGRGQSFVYELVYDGKGQDGRPFLPGLLDVTTLEAIPSMSTTEAAGGVNGHLGGGSGAHGGAIGAAWGIVANGREPGKTGHFTTIEGISLENASPGLAPVRVVVRPGRPPVPDREVRP